MEPMSTYFLTDIYAQGLWQGLTVSLSAGAIGWMVSLGFRTWNNIIGK